MRRTTQTPAVVWPKFRIDLSGNSLRKSADLQTAPVDEGAGGHDHCVGDVRLVVVVQLKQGGGEAIENVMLLGLTGVHKSCEVFQGLEDIISNVVHPLHARCGDCNYNLQVELVGRIKELCCYQGGCMIDEYRTTNVPPLRLLPHPHIS